MSLMTDVSHDHCPSTTALTTITFLTTRLVPGPELIEPHLTARGYADTNPVCPTSVAACTVAATS